MLRVYADRYIDLGERINDAKAVLQYTEDNFPIESDRQMIRKELDKIGADLIEIEGLCRELELPTASKLIRKHMGTPPNTRREYQILIDAVYAELEGKLFLYVPTNLAKFYEDDDILSENARLKYPSPYREMRESGCCISCGLWTASVFHSMRAAEIGVKGLGNKLGVAFPDKPIELAEWHQILDQSDSKIKAIGQLPKSIQRDEDQLFYSTAAAQFRYFKDGWRVRVAHGRAIYVEAEAIKLLDHTRDFFETLSLRLSE